MEMAALAQVTWNKRKLQRCKFVKNCNPLTKNTLNGNSDWIIGMVPECTVCSRGRKSQFGQFEAMTSCSMLIRDN